MGTSGNWSRADILKYQAEVARINEERAQLRNNKRLEIAQKIVQIVSDAINAKVIRPGPHPEERECYDLALELRAMAPELEQCVVHIFDAEDGVN